MASAKRADADTLTVNKFKLLFAKINEPNCVMDNYYADGLINKIIDTRKDTNYTCYISELLFEPMQRLENYHISVQVFLIRLLACCARKELYFTKILCKKSNIVSKAYSKHGAGGMVPSLRVAYQEVALSLVEHHTGLRWLLDTGMWKEFLSANNDFQTVFVTRQKYKFASKLLWRVNDTGDEANVRAVLDYILKPLEKDIAISDSITSEEEEEISKEFEPMLHMMDSIMSDVSHTTKPSLAFSALLTHFNLVPHLLIVFDRFRKKSLTSVLSKLLFRLSLTKLFHQKPLTRESVYTMEDFIELKVMYFNTIQYFIMRRCALSILDYCHTCNMIWNMVWHDKKPEMSKPDGQKEDLQNKMLFMCLGPSLFYIGRYEPVTSLEDSIQEYIMRLIKASCEHTAKAAYGFRELTLELDTMPIVLQSVKRLSSLNNSMNNEQANLIFQGLFYVLKKFDPTDPANQEIKVVHNNFQDDQEDLIIFTYVLEAILLLVKNFDINWQESLEVICLYNLVYNCLKKPNLSSKFVVTALNVIAVTVKKFLPPNLSLLMESKPGSAMHELGRLIYMKMHDLHWEVRDSALELLQVCTEISYIKFPPFQKQIIENDLLVVATALALNDHEFYARASALKCLGAACKVSAIWDQLRNKHPDIQDSLLGVLSHNQEGIVRKEACNVLCEIYLNLKLTPAFKRRMYEQMVTAAISDFHWEVQMTALKFWRSVIHTRLCEQGMLDGTFPPVTFSKESRKIVTLNKAEIQRRLLKILDELASMGCLTVLTKLLHEDTEVEVMDASLSISSLLLDILKRYEVPDCLKPGKGEPRTIQEFYNDTSTTNDKMEDDDVVMIKTEEDDDVILIKTEEDDDVILVKTEEDQSDNVIESILKADDMNLLAHIYERHMRMNDKPELQLKPSIKLMRYVPPYLFVKHLMSKDFKGVIEYKKQWRDGIRSVDSLLDDVLGIYEAGQEANDLDCY